MPTTNKNTIENRISEDIQTNKNSEINITEDQATQQLLILHGAIQNIEEHNTNNKKLKESYAEIITELKNKINELQFSIEDLTESKLSLLQAEIKQPDVRIEDSELAKDVIDLTKEVNDLHVVVTGDTYVHETKKTTATIIKEADEGRNEAEKDTISTAGAIVESISHPGLKNAIKRINDRAT